MIHYVVAIRHRRHPEKVRFVGEAYRTLKDATDNKYKFDSQDYRLIGVLPVEGPDVLIQPKEFTPIDFKDEVVGYAFTTTPYVDSYQRTSFAPFSEFKEAMQIQADSCIHEMMEMLEKNNCDIPYYLNQVVRAFGYFEDAAFIQTVDGLFQVPNDEINEMWDVT